MTDVLVIGGGAAGMMAAITAAKQGASVTVLERNEKLGKKIYITGKGRCNVTNDCTREEFLQEVAQNPRFLFSALSQFSPQDMMHFLEEKGCPVTVQRGRRVFPQTEKASDVTRTLQQTMQSLGVRVQLGCKVQSIETEDGAVTGVTLENGAFLSARKVILATGGVSYPMTGSDGSGYALAQALGHTLVPPRASLSALQVEGNWCAELMGLSLRNVTLEMKVGKKVIFSELGEMLFTHFGISGPLALTMSCHLPEKVQEAKVTLNLKPGLTAEQLNARIQRELDAQPRKMLVSILPSLLPGRFAERFPNLVGLDGSKTCAQVTKAEREKLCNALQAFPIVLKGYAPIAEAIVTRGGVSVKEVAPSTMASKKVTGLYLAGEVLDVDAHTGGYNLQIAWSTGYVAGLHAATGEA